MEFGLSEEQRLLVDNVRRFLSEQYPLDRVREFAAGEDDGASVAAGLRDLGISALLVPEDHGGVGLGLLEAALVAETIGYHVTPARFTASGVMAPRALQLSGNRALADTHLGALATGSITVGAAVSELCGARGGAGVLARDGKLNGRALFVLDYGADFYLVGSNERELYLVAAAAQGIEGRGLTTVDGSRHLGELTFADTPAEPLALTPEQVQNVLDWGRVALAADSLGAAQCMLDQAVAYAKQREQFDRVIASFQAVKHMCAEMAAGLEPCRAMLWYAGHAQDAELPEARRYACHTKAHVSEVTQFVARTATEVHGGMGFTDLVGLHYWFKRIGANRQYLGSPERLREEAARDQALVA